MSDDRLLQDLGAEARRQQESEDALRAQHPELFLPETSVAPATPPRPWATVTRLVTLGALAAAAMAAVVFLNRNPGPLPDYDLALKSGGASSVRTSTTTKVTRLVPGLRLELVARPASRIEGRVYARLDWVDGTQRTPTKAQIKIDPSGAIDVVGTIGQEIAVPPGPGRLELVIDRQPIPDAADPANETTRHVSLEVQP